MSESTAISRQLHHSRGHDHIVVLVGPNNAGKSTILRAYEVVMNDGSGGAKLRTDDFPSEKVDPENLPEIELETYVWEDLPAEKWIHTDPETGKKYIRERWRWNSPNDNPKRQGRNSQTEDWDEQVPWGAPNVAKSRRPVPHRVDAFASPDEQGEKVTEIIRNILIERAMASTGEDELSTLQKLTGDIRQLQSKIVDESQYEIDAIQTALGSYIAEIFFGFKVTLDARHDEVQDKAISVFSAKPIIRMGPENGHMAPLEKQGSGARRTLLWSALKIASEKTATPKAKIKAKAAAAKAEEGQEAEELKRPHVLLLDEPEICLHPSAIRDACRVIYDLASAGTGWQVMVTTHSPQFIDVSRDNTTIVRVYRDETGMIQGTTVFRPEAVSLSPEDKELLKLLNQWDPYVAEFFFGGRTVVVEGDTEYSAFREIIESNRAKYRDVHVVRARGKFIIPILMKILNHFGSRYSVLHDTDTPKTADGKGNPAWAANEAIRKVAAAASNANNVRVAASLLDFERALFNESAQKEKPYKMVMRLRGDAAAQGSVAEVLDYLLFEQDQLPKGIVSWNDIEQLGAIVKAAI
ncbi:ATP-dependent nuclease [Rhizobium rhizogenes]|uniref:ATP-dependent nuclease n=1 Tax=Rhizobium rhizogenes TaxID=359 RepID=UPI001574A413|nr:AAA family ATPase [Rhizobium rhizogenes]NTF91687.1 AAA family ATPase [Rhizobium rhizogenes]